MYIYIYIYIYIYTTGPVNEPPVSVKNSVSEGHPAGFTRDRYERKKWQLGYEPNSEVRNLGSETIVSLMVKTAKLYK